MLQRKERARKSTLGGSQTASPRNEPVAALFSGSPLSRLKGGSDAKPLNSEPDECLRRRGENSPRGGRASRRGRARRSRSASSPRWRARALQLDRVVRSER